MTREHRIERALFWREQATSMLQRVLTPDEFPDWGAWRTPHTIAWLERRFLRAGRILNALMQRAECA